MHGTLALLTSAGAMRLLDLLLLVSDTEFMWWWHRYIGTGRVKHGVLALLPGTRAMGLPDFLFHVTRTIAFGKDDRVG